MDDYRQKVYTALKGELGDSFTKSLDEFNKALDSDPTYKDKVYTALKGELGDTFTKTPEEFSELVKKKDIGVPVQDVIPKAVSVSQSSKGGESVSATLDEAQTTPIAAQGDKYTEQDLNWFKTVQSNPRSLNVSDSAQVQKYRDMTDYMRKKREQTEVPVSSIGAVKEKIQSSSSFIKENTNKAKVEKFKQMFPNEIQEGQDDITSLIDIQGKIAMAEASGNGRYDAYKYAAPDMGSEAAVNIISSIEDAIQKVEDAKKRGVLKNVGVGTVQGISDYFKDYLTLGTTIGNSKAVKELEDKLRRIDGGSKEELTKGETSLLQALQTAEEAAKTIDKEMPEALRLGEGLGGSIGFMAEFGLTGGVGAAAKKAVIKGAVKMGAKSTAAKAGVGVVSAIAKAGVQSAAMPTFYKEVSKKVANGESGISAVGNALYETGVDVLTEGMWGAKIPVGEGAKNIATRLASKVGNAIADEKGIKGLAVGFAKEYVEEKTAEALNAAKDIAQGEQTYDEFAAQFIDVKNNLRTAASVAVMTGVLGGAQEGIRAYAGMGLNSDIKMTGSKLPSDIRSAVDDITANRDLTQKEVFDLVSQSVKGADVENKKELLVQASRYATAKLAREAYDEVVRAKTSKVEGGEVVSEIEEPSPEVDEDQQKVDYLLKAGVQVPDGTTMEQLDDLYQKQKQKDEIVSVAAKQVSEAKPKEEAISPIEPISEPVEARSTEEVSQVSPEQKEGLKQTKQDVVGDPLKDVESTEKALDVISKDNADILNKMPNISWHGSKNKELIFGKPKDGSTRKSKMQLDFGTHFTEEGYASFYSGDKGRNYPAIIDLKKPLDLTKGIWFKDDREFDEIHQLIKDLKLEKEYGSISMYDRDGKKHEDIQSVSITANKLDTIAPKKITEALKKHEYDGVIYEPYHPVGGQSGMRFIEKKPKSFIVLDNLSIKEASTKNIAEAYHKAKQDGSNPELVNAVEQLIQKQQPTVVEPLITEVEQLTTKQDGKETSSETQGGQKGRQEVLTEKQQKAVREVKREENKQRLASIFDDIATLTGARKEITGEERRIIRKRILDNAVEYVKTEFELVGDALREKVKSFLKENNFSDEDIIDEEIDNSIKEKGYAKGTRTTAKEAGGKKEVVKGEEGQVRVRDDAKDGVEAGKGEVKQRGFQTGSMEKAGGKFAEIAKEHPLFYTEKTENQQLKDAAAWLDGKSEDAIMSALTTGKSGTPEQRVNRKTLYAMYLQDKLNDFVEKGMDEDANAAYESLVKVTDSLAKEGTDIARGLQAYAKFQRMNPKTVVWTVNNEIKKSNRDKFPEADIEAVAESEADIKRMGKDLSQETLDDKRLTDIIDDIANKNKGKKKQQTYSEKAKEVADKVRKIKPSSWGVMFSDPTLATAAFEVALEATAKAIEISGNIADSIAKGINTIKRSDWYKGLTNDQKRKAERVFEVNVKKDLGVDALSKDQLGKYLKTEMKDLELSLKEVIKKHWTDPNSLGITLSDRIVSDLGLTQKEADLVQNTINDILKEKLADKIDNYIFNEALPKGKAQKEIFINKMGEFLMMGNIDHQYFREAFANKFGLTPTLTKDQAKLISDLNKAVVETKNMGVFGDMAANEFAREIDKLLPKTKAEELFNGMFGLDYANALSGATTHYVNMKSVFFNLLARPLMDITRVEDWISAARNGRVAELPILNALNSWLDFARAMGHGTTDFRDIMKSGDLRAMHKYISEVKSIAHLNVPELERHKTGAYRFKPIKITVNGKEIDLNVANYMKFVGRALAAEDAFSYRGFEAVELASALRKKLRKQGLSESEIKKHIAQQVYGRQLSQAELAEVEKQLQKEKEGMEAFGFKTDKLKENRRRLEIIREKLLDFKEEELVNLKEVAKGNVFNDTRGGVVNSVMSSLSQFANKNVFTKIITMPHFMFFRIAGNIGDFMIDTIPGYGQARARGWSPTTMYATYLKHKGDGMAGDKAAIKAITGKRVPIAELPFKTAQLGDKGSFNRQQQMDRARLGNMMLLSQVALVMGLYAIGGDDKDENGEPWFDISGGRFFDKDIYARDTKLMPTYTVKIGKWKWKYGNAPVMTFGLSVLGNYADMVKAGISEEEISDRLKLMSRSFWYSIGALTDQQLMQGFKSMMESGLNLIKTARAIKAKEADQGDNPVNKVASNVIEYLVKKQASPAVGWLPTKNNLFQQSLQTYMGTARESKDIPSMLAYDLGIHHFTNRPALDALGNEVKRKPGYTGIYYEPAMITEDPKRWEMVRWLEQNNAYPATYYNRDERYVYAQPKSKGWIHDALNREKPSYEKKMPTEEEFWQFRKMAGEMVQKDLMRYKDATYNGKKVWEIEAKEEGSNGKTMMQEKVTNYILKAKEQTRLYLFTWNELGKKDSELFKKLYTEKVLPTYETTVKVYKKTDDGEEYRDENGKLVVLDRKPLMDEELAGYNRDSFILYMDRMKANSGKSGEDLKEASDLAWDQATREAAKPHGGKATKKRSSRSMTDILNRAK